MRILLFLAALACASPDADAGERKQYLELVNRAKDSVTSLSVAPAGTDAYTDIPLREPLRGGGTATTLQVPAETCRYDFRFAFRDGRSLLYPNIDVCRASVLRVRPLPRSGEPRFASSQGR